MGLPLEAMALESVGNSELGLEGIKKTLTKLKTKVQKKLKELSLRISNYFKEQTSLATSLSSEISKRIKKLDSAEINDTVKFSLGKYLTIKGTAMTADDIINSLGLMMAYHKAYGKGLAVNANMMTAIVKEMQVYILKTLDKEDVLDSLNNINSLVDKWIFEYSTTMKAYLSGTRTQVDRFMRITWDNSAEGDKKDKLTFMTEPKPSFNIDNPAILVNSDHTKISRAYIPSESVKSKNLQFRISKESLVEILKTLKTMLNKYVREVDNNDLELVESRLETAYMRTTTVNERGFGVVTTDVTVSKVLNRVYYVAAATSFEVAMAELKRVRIISNTILTLVDRAIK